VSGDINIYKLAMCVSTVTRLGIVYRVKDSFHIWKGGDRREK